MAHLLINIRPPTSTLLRLSGVVSTLTLVFIHVINLCSYRQSNLVILVDTLHLSLLASSFILHRKTSHLSCIYIHTYQITSSFLYPLVSYTRTLVIVVLNLYSLSHMLIFCSQFEDLCSCYQSRSFSLEDQRVLLVTPSGFRYLTAR